MYKKKPATRGSSRGGVVAQQTAATADNPNKESDRGSHKEESLQVVKKKKPVNQNQLEFEEYMKGNLAL